MWCRRPGLASEPHFTVIRPTRPLLALPILVALGMSTEAIAQGGISTTSHPAKQPPFYRGSGFVVQNPARLDIELQLPDGLPEKWVPVSALERLATDMNQWLVARFVQVSAGSEPLRLDSLQSDGRAIAPRVTLGCQLDFSDECSEEERSNQLQVSSASRAWREATRQTLAEQQADALLVVHLQIAPHWIHQRGLRGDKEVRLGTRHVQSLPWLTSLDTPVWVIQVTGALVDVEGKVRRSGAEGIWALRTPMRASVLDAQQLLREADIEQVRTTLVREDLPGHPLSWQVALEDLLNGLLRPPS